MSIHGAAAPFGTVSSPDGSLGSENGQLEGSIASALSIENTAAPLIIGGGPSADGEDEAAVYTVPLTAGQILAHYNARN